MSAQRRPVQALINVENEQVFRPAFEVLDNAANMLSIPVYIDFLISQWIASAWAVDPFSHPRAVSAEMFDYALDPLLLVSYS
ncbi:MAG: hypothetical protein CMN28_05530 [Salinisphaeraceae bacterium]|nr:hypothetical protein [Salinisphaeraceae bacterium]